MIKGSLFHVMSEQKRHMMITFSLQLVKRSGIDKKTHYKNV
jgi:hypothetical protein